MNEIASAVRKARLSKGWSYRRLADQASIESVFMPLISHRMSHSTVQRLEEGKDVLLSNLLPILKALGLTWVPVCEHEYICRHCGEEATRR